MRSWKLTATMSARLVRAKTKIRDAAIQSVHCDRRRTGQTNWSAIAQLYRGLSLISPTSAVSIGLASALVHCGAATEALAVLEQVSAQHQQVSAAYWAVRAEILSLLGHQDEAATAYRRAIGLTEAPAERVWLMQKAESLGSADDTFLVSQRQR